ncbi:MAG: histidinol-phosphatase HisJ family protein [Eubacterium sp.]
MYKNIYDTHTHSVFSFDGNHTCEALCKSAYNQNALGIAITDHCDIDGDNFDYLDFAEKQFRAVEKVKEEYAGKLKIYSGIELGQGIYEKEKSQAILEKYNYDITIGSIHNLENMEDFYFLDYKKYNIEHLLTEYFTAEYELARWNMADTLAHLTYPLRYIVAREKIDVDISKYYDIIDSIFEELIKNDKALELNVSGLFMDMRDTLPNKELIKRFRKMGGKYVTVGSDSHYAEKVCNGIEMGYDILLECGYDKFTVFENHQPMLITIE